MRAFIEDLCEHAGIVRSGPDAEKFGDPYDYAVVYRIEDSVAHVKALTSQDKKFSLAHFKAIVAALESRGLIVKWQRIRRKTDQMFHAKLVITQDGEDFWDTNWYNIKDVVEFEEAIANALFALARKKMADAMKAAS